MRLIGPGIAEHDRTMSAVPPLLKPKASLAINAICTWQWVVVEGGGR